MYPINIVFCKKKPYNPNLDYIAIIPIKILIRWICGG